MHFSDAESSLHACGNASYSLSAASVSRSSATFDDALLPDNDTIQTCHRPASDEVDQNSSPAEDSSPAVHGDIAESSSPSVHSDIAENNGSTIHASTSAAIPIAILTSKGPVHQVNNAFLSSKLTQDGDESNTTSPAKPSKTSLDVLLAYHDNVSSHYRDHKGKKPRKLLGKILLSIKVKLPKVILNALAHAGTLCILQRLSSFLTTIIEEIEFDQSFDAAVNTPLTPGVLFEDGFSRLPRELQLYLLKFLLVHPAGIINPSDRYHENGFGGKGEISMLKQPSFIRPGVLAACKSLYAEGLPIMYNKVVLTRDISDNPSAVMRFFSQVHLTFGEGDDSSAFGVNTLYRSSLVKRIELRDSSEHYFNGFDFTSSIPPRVRSRLHHPLHWTFAMLRHMEFTGLNLDTLTMVIDENSFNTRKVLQSEAKMREYSLPGNFQTMITDDEVVNRQVAWLELCEENSTSDIWNPEKYPLTGDEEIRSDKGVLVKKLYIHGTSTTNAHQHQVLPNGKLRVTNPTALLVLLWMVQTGIQPLVTEFTGPVGGFQERELTDDDTWDIDEELAATSKAAREASWDQVIDHWDLGRTIDSDEW